MPLIHAYVYACILLQGADIEARCRWTNMNALHYTAFFDVPDIVQALVETKPGEKDGGVSERCRTCML